MTIQYHIHELAQWDLLTTKDASLAIFESEWEAINHIELKLPKGNYIITKVYCK